MRRGDEVKYWVQDVIGPEVAQGADKPSARANRVEVTRFRLDKRGERAEEVLALLSRAAGLVHAKHRKKKMSEAASRDDLLRVATNQPLWKLVGEVIPQLAGAHMRGIANANDKHVQEVRDPGDRRALQLSRTRASQHPTLTCAGSSWMIKKLCVRERERERERRSQ